MKFNYVIMQCGGLGLRMGQYTRNRPKALVPVNNRPLIFHLFERYPEKKYIIIGDYRDDVLNRYLETFAKVQYMSFKSLGKGNAAGVKQALSFIPDGEGFMLLWSDIILGSNFKPEDLPTPDAGYIGITDRFTCSWSFHDGVLAKTELAGYGVAGCFMFRDKSALQDLPDEGSFTRWLQGNNVPLAPMDMADTVEIGTVSALERYDVKSNRCRPYNRIDIDGERVTKIGLTDEGRALLKREEDWYAKLSGLKFSGIPEIYSMQPLVMQRIHGDNVFLANIHEDRKPIVLRKIVDKLKELHNLEAGRMNPFDIYKDYYQKTLQRVRSIAAVIPFADRSSIVINGRECRNVLADSDSFRSLTEEFCAVRVPFGLIHGDCTFTNTLIDSEENIYFIDARGYFGSTSLVGDVNYDWAKVYYSIVGAFDNFNVKRFTLAINHDDVSFSIESSGWESYSDYFFELVQSDTRRIKFIHAIVWLSLASHCWEDYDSMCLAFYNGTYLLDALATE